MGYDSSSYVLSGEIAGEGILPITNIQMTTIGRLNQKFNLPTNTSTALNGSLLSIDSSSKNTTWQSDYLKYNTSTTQITNNVTGSAVAITDLTMSGTIGKSTTEKFVLPSNTSTAGVGSVLRLNNTTTKTTDWVQPAITTETSITTAIPTATASVVEMCRATNLTAGTYLITYYIDLSITGSITAYIFISLIWGIDNEWEFK
jgi:hypothetical protein